MADLPAKKREQLPAKDFGLPEKARTKSAKKESGNYPMPDKSHARNAKSRAAQQEKAGNLTQTEREKIDRKAEKILDE
jgi:hypothetical protein